MKTKKNTHIEAITLPKDAVYTLKALLAEINYEESLDEECDQDLVVEDTYKVLSILSGILGV